MAKKRSVKSHLMKGYTVQPVSLQIPQSLMANTSTHISGLAAFTAWIWRAILSGKKDIGQMRKRNTFGEGSCPHHPRRYNRPSSKTTRGPSFITALDKHTGDEIWKIDRDERTTWTSPIIVEHDGKAQVVVAATNRSRSLRFGKRRPIMGMWRYDRKCYSLPL